MSDHGQGERWLLLIFHEDLSLAILEPPLLAGALRIGKYHFDRIEFSDFLGFVDFLRDTGGRVVGARWQCMHEWAFFRAHLSRCRQVEVLDSTKEIRVYFGERRDFDEHRSDDRDFGIEVFARVRGRSGTLGIAIPCKHIPEDDLRASVCAPVAWSSCETDPL